MSKRKKNNLKLRIERHVQALLRINHAAAVCVSGGYKGMMDTKRLEFVELDNATSSAVRQTRLKWVIYLAAFCVKSDGEGYIKGEELVLEGTHLGKDLDAVLAEYHQPLRDRCNPSHLIGSGWIASPVGVSFTEKEAAKIFEKAGCWRPLALREMRERADALALSAKSKEVGNALSATA